MKKIAIIAPCILPVPATKGGAVEELITKIIEYNESDKRFLIDLYTISDGKNTNNCYENCNLIEIKSSRLTRIIDDLSDKAYRRIPNSNSRRLLDRIICRLFTETIEKNDIIYDYVIVENMASTALEIINVVQGKYAFPVYFHIHNDIDIYRSASDIRSLVKNGGQFISVSRYMRDSIRRCAPDAIVHILNNGINMSQYDKCPKKASDTFKFLYLGRVIPEKGVRELIYAFEKLLNNPEANYKNYRLDIVGFSEHKTRYEMDVLKIASKYPDIIKCINRLSVEDIDKTYSEHDVVVMPTLIEEMFGLVALETIAKGMALIATNSGALPEVVGDGALIVKKNHDLVNNLTAAMIRISVDEDFRNELQERAYKRAHSIKEYDIENYYDNFVDIIDGHIEDDDFISVIVPVYNVSSCLERCVLSIMNQTFEKLEIILVDDGSTDDSGAVCDRLASVDERIIVIHQENMGLSGARNTGIEHSRGKYLFFCDSDDLLEKNALESLLKKMKEDNADVVACGFAKIYDDYFAGNGEAEVLTDSHFGRWSGHDSVIQMMRSNNICTVAWNKLYKKFIFDGIRFPVGEKNEDEATIYKVLYKAGIVSYLPEPFYKYYQRETSIMHEDFGSRYTYFLKASKDRVDYFRDLNEKELEQHSLITLLEWIKYSYRRINEKEIRQELVELYKESISFGNAPSVMGIKKQIALLLWKYVKY